MAGERRKAQRATMNEDGTIQKEPVRMEDNGEGVSGDKKSTPASVKLREFGDPIVSIPRVTLAKSHTEGFAKWVAQSYTDPVVLTNTHFANSQLRDKMTPEKLTKLMDGWISELGGVVRRSEHAVFEWLDTRKPWHPLLQQMDAHYNASLGRSLPIKDMEEMTLKGLFRNIKGVITRRSVDPKNQDDPISGYDTFYHYTQAINDAPEIKDLMKIATALNIDSLLLPNVNLSERVLWVASPGATSQCHYDNTANFYAQVQGSMRVILFPPASTPALFLNSYLHPKHRRSQVNISFPGSRSSLHGRFSIASKLGKIAVLNPGDVLYVPPFWHRHSTALSTSLTLYGWSETGAMKNLTSFFAFPNITAFKPEGNWTNRTVVALAALLETILEQTYGEDWPMIGLPNQGAAMSGPAKFVVDFLKPRYSLIAFTMASMVSRMAWCPSVLSRHKLPKAVQHPQSKDALVPETNDLKQNRRHRRNQLMKKAGWDAKEAQRLAKAVSSSLQALESGARDILVADYVEALVTGTLGDPSLTPAFLINCLCQCGPTPEELLQAEPKKEESPPNSSAESSAVNQEPTETKKTEL